MLSTSPLLDYSPWSALSAPPVLQGEVDGGEESRAPLGARPAEGMRTTALWAQQISAEDVRCLCSGVTGLHTSRWLFGTPSEKYWSLIPSARKKACLRKEHKGNFKDVFIFPSSGQERETKPTLQDEQQERGALCIICYRWKEPWCYNWSFCFSCASLLWGARAHIVYWQQKRSFCLCKTLFFFLA